MIIFAPDFKQYLIVGLSTGLRLKEMLSLKISNIDIKNNIIHVVNDDSFQTKNGRNRDIPISQFLKPYLDHYLKYWIHPRTFELQKRSIAHMETLFCNKDGQPIKSFKTSFSLLSRTQIYLPFNGHNDFNIVGLLFYFKLHPHKKDYPSFKIHEKLRLKNSGRRLFFQNFY